MTQRRPPGGKNLEGDPAETIAPTMMGEGDLGDEPMTIRDPTLEVERVPMRPKPKRPPKKGAGPVAWILVILLLAGIGAAVTVVVMQGQSAEPAAAADAGGASSGGSAASADAGGADAGASAAADDAGGEVQAASADDAAAEAAEEAVAATDDAAAEGAEEAVAATDDATPGDDVAVAAVDDAAAAPTDDAAVAAVDDAAPAAPADDAAAVVAAGDAGAVAMAGDAVVAGDVVMVAAPKPPNPAEAKRLNEVGFAARKAGDHAGAMAAYKAAVAADADNVWAHYNYACELALAGNSKDALAELVLVYKLDTGESRKALAAARKDSDFASLRDLGQFQRLTR